MTIQIIQQHSSVHWLRHHFYVKCEDQSSLLEFFDDVKLWLEENVKGSGLIFDFEKDKSILDHILTSKRLHHSSERWYLGLGQDDFMVYFYRRKDTLAFKEAFKIIDYDNTKPKLSRSQRKLMVKIRIKKDSQYSHHSSYRYLSRGDDE